MLLNRAHRLYVRFMPRAEWLLIMFLTVTRKVSYLLEVFALLVCGEKVLVQGIDQNISGELKLALLPPSVYNKY